MQVFGEGEFSVRALSTAFGLLALPLVYLVGRELAGRSAGIVAAALYATAAPHIAYAQEARSYAQLTLVATVALLGLVRISCAVEDGRSVRRRDLALFAAGALATIYTHGVGVFYVAAMDASLLLVLAIQWRSGDAAARRRVLGAVAGGALANVAILVLAAPQFYSMVVLRSSAGLAWMPTPTLRNVAGLIKDLLFAPGPGETGLWPGAAGLAVALALWGWVAWRSLRRPRAVVLAVGLVLPLLAGAAMVAVSFARPVLLPRTALWLTIPLYALAGVAVASLPTARAKAMAVAAGLALQIGGIATYHWTAFKDNWREVLPAVAAAAGPNDLFVFLSSDMVPPFAYYWPGHAFDFDRCRLLADQGPGHYYVPMFEITLRCRAEISPQAVSTELATGRPVWLVARGEENVALLDALKARLAPDIADSARIDVRLNRLVRIGN
jgi:mannosyltransferase